MIQILVWASCGLIFGVGYCGKYLEELVALKKGTKRTSGPAFFLLMFLLAAALFILSLVQGQALENLLK